MTTEETPHAEQLAVIVKLSNGKYHQVMLTKEQADILLNAMPAFLDRKTLPLLPRELETITLEPYKTGGPRAALNINHESNMPTYGKAG